MTKQEQAMRNAAKVELDRLTALYRQAFDRYEECKGKLNEDRMFKDAMGIYHRLEATKQAYGALGITGSLGVHFIEEAGA
jgi:hypothetical protein